MSTTPTPPTPEAVAANTKKPMKTKLLKLAPAAFCDATDACSEGRQFAIKHATMADVWDNCPRVDWLCWILNAIDAPADDRAMRLYACWCVRNTPLADGRRVWDLLTDKRSRNAVVVAERFANGQATRDELDAARDAAWDAAWAAARDAARDAARAAAWAAARDAARAAARDAARAAARDAAWAAQVAEFRRIVSNPFKEVGK